MNAVRRFSRALLALAAASTLAFLAACNGGGGGSSPTAPLSTYPLIAGAWSGHWLIVEFGDEVIEVSLVQNSAEITGTLTADGVEIPIAGTLSVRDGSGRAALLWHVPASALDCGFVDGSLVVSQNDTRMNGTGRIGTAGCDGEPELFAGTLSLSRKTSALSAADSAVGDRGRVGAILGRVLRRTP